MLQVTWGDDFSGGDSSFLQGELQNVEKIQDAPLRCMRV